MLKILRKYGKHFMVVAGSLLLIAWLMPSAMKELVGNPEKRVVMTVDGHKVRLKEYQHWTQEFAALRGLLGGEMLDSAEHYMLLAKAAEKAGLVGSAAEGRASIPQIAEQRARMIEMEALRQQYPQFPISFFSQILDPAKVQAQAAIQEAMLTANLQESARSALPVKDIEKALARLRGIARLTSGYSRIARVSRPRALLEAQRQLDKATIDVVLVSSDRNMSEVQEPDDATLQEHLNAYKDRRPGEGEFGIGYLLPPRAKIQYLTLDRAKIADKVVADIKELKRVFREEYTPAKPGETFEEARPALERQYKGKVVDQVLAYADQSFRTEVALATRQLADNPETGIKTLPPGWSDERLDLSAIAHRIVAWVEEKTRPDPSRPGIRIDPPQVTTRNSQFLLPTDLAEIPGIGTSFRMRGSARESFADYVLSVRELKPKSTLTLQTRIPFEEPTRDSTGNVYYITVMDTRPESVPASVDEARARLVKDWKRLEGFKKLADRDVETLKQRAIKEGLASLAENNIPEPGQPAPPPALKSNLNVSRVGISPPTADVDFPVFRDKVLEAAAKFDPTQDISALDISERTFVVPLPQKLSLAIGVVKSLTPVTTEAYRQSQLRLSGQVQNDETRELKDTPYSLERLRKRLNVEFPIEEEEDQESGA